MVDDERMPLQAGEIPVMRKVRFRTLGCYPLSGAIESHADSLEAIMAELIAARMPFDLKYDSAPNWETYDATLRMAGQLMQRLAPLGAKDMIDVQAFMWVTRELN